MKYRNKFETQTAEFLSNKKIKFGYESEKLDYVIEAKYVPDFIIETKRGKKIYIETKGNGRSFDGAARRKLIAVKNGHQDKDIRIVFYSDGKIGPKRKDGTFMRQSDWAKKHWFKYAIKSIPDEWLK